MTKNQKQLLKRIKQDDPGVWDDFVKEYLPLVLRIIKKHPLGGLIPDYSVTAEKVLRERFKYFRRKEIWVNLNTLFYRPTLFQIYKDSKKQQDPDTIKKSDNFFDEFPDPSQNPLNNLIEREEKKEHKLLLKLLETCRNKLTQTQKLVIKMWLDGNSWAQIARIRGTTQTAVWCVWNKAISRLRRCIRELQKIR